LRRQLGVRYPFESASTEALAPVKCHDDQA
jgi:hypothetical protein